jgi:nucleotide-binding universal stress UspA family protein
MHVLFATDLTEPPAAVRKVLRMTERLDGELYVLHAISPQPTASAPLEPGMGGGFAPYDTYDPALEKHIRQAEEHAFHEFLTDRFDRSVRAALRQGRPAEVILDDADEQNADLILLCHRPQSRLEKMLLGSTAGTVVRKARRPTLLIPVLDEDEAS